MLVNLTVIVADGTFVFPQYCNGGDLADYLQGKRCCNMKHTLRLFIMISYWFCRNAM